MDTMLSSFEQDINTTNTSTTTTDSNTWTDSVLSHNLDRNTIQNYKNMVSCMSDTVNQLIPVQ